MSSQGWRRRVAESSQASAVVAVLGPFAPPLGWALVAASLPDQDWERLSKSDRRIVAVAAPGLPAGFLGALATAIAALASPGWRGALVPLFLAFACACFACSVLLRSVLLSHPPLEIKGETGQPEGRDGLPRRR